MDIPTKLNLTFIILSGLSFLSIGLFRGIGIDPNIFTKGVVLLVLGVSICGVIITAFVRIWA